MSWRIVSFYACRILLTITGAGANKKARFARPREEPNMSGELEKLLNEAKRKEMTPEQWEEQRRSFAYGNTKIENDGITRETVDREAEDLAAKHG